MALDDLSGLRWFLDEKQRIAQDSLLKIRHKRPTQGISWFEPAWIERARRAHLAGRFGIDRDDHCRYPSQLYFALNRNDRAVTHIRSAACQYDYISARLLLDFFGYLRRDFFIHLL